MENFKEGDEVQHISGGPKMIVIGFGTSKGPMGIHYAKTIVDKNKLICQWYDTNTSTFIEKLFLSSALKIMENKGNITIPSPRINNKEK